MATAYRYWRVNLLTGNGNGRTWVYDLEMRGVVGGPDLTVPGGPFTVNVQDSTEVGLRAIDGSAATAWNSGSSPYAPVAVGTYDFGTPVVIAEIAIRHTSVFDVCQWGSWVSASNDGVNWVRFGPVFGENGPVPWVYHVLHPIALSVEADPAAIRAEPRPAALTPTSWPVSSINPNAEVAGGFMLIGDDVGPYRIAGTAYVKGTPNTPAYRLVRLHDRASGRPVREVWSDAVTGAYLFDDLPLAPDRYYVIEFDHLGVHNAAIKDRIQAIL